MLVVVVVAVLVIVLGLGVGDVVVGLVHPAMKTAVSITSFNIPATNDFFVVNP